MPEELAMLLFEANDSLRVPAEMVVAPENVVLSADSWVVCF